MNGDEFCTTLHHANDINFLTNPLSERKCAGAHHRFVFVCPRKAATPTESMYPPQRLFSPFIPPAPIRPIQRASWTPEKSQVESGEHQNNANIHHQPRPEMASEDYEIHADYAGRHRRHIKHGCYLSAHSTSPLRIAQIAFIDEPFANNQLDASHREALSSPARSDVQHNWRTHER